MDAKGIKSTLTDLVKTEQGQETLGLAVGLLAAPLGYKLWRKLGAPRWAALFAVDAALRRMTDEVKASRRHREVLERLDQAATPRRWDRASGRGAM